MINKGTWIDEEDQNNNNNMANKYQEIKYIYLIEQMLIRLRKLDSNIRCEQREKKKS